MITATDIQTRRTIESMCLTWRHDYGLNKTGCSITSGMTEGERAVLRNQMEQIHEHHIAPLEEVIHRLRQQLESVQASRRCAPATPVYTAEMGQAAHDYIDSCCRSATGELLVRPPSMPGGFRWEALYEAMLSAAAAGGDYPVGQAPASCV